MSTTLSLAKQLIAIDSVTPHDKGCQALMIERLKAVGFTIKRLRFGQVDNFWARRGTDSPIICFAGHTDVVPTGPEDKWQFPPFEPTEHDGYIYGRGAADMKGSLASMVVSCEEFVRKHPDHKGSIAFLITSDEEGPAVDGTARVVNWLTQHNIHIDQCIVGEPSSSRYTGDTIKHGRRGSLGAALTVKGVQGHVAYPHLAKNPVHAAAPALAELSTAEWDQGNVFFPPTTLQISNISAGTGATNVIPGTCSVLMNFRFSTASTAEQLIQRTEQILARHNVEFDIEWHLSGQPFLTAAGELIDTTQSAIKEVTGRQASLSTAGGTSDGRFIAPTGSQVIELGPVNTTIHQLNECTNITELDHLTLIYEGILTRTLSKH